MLDGTKSDVVIQSKNTHVTIKMARASLITHDYNKCSKQLLPEFMYALL